MNQAQCPFLRHEKVLPLNCAVGRTNTGATKLQILERMFAFQKKQEQIKKRTVLPPHLVVFYYRTQLRHKPYTGIDSAPEIILSNRQAELFRNNTAEFIFTD